MGVAENPHKIENIVRGQFSELLEIYRPLLGEAGLRLDETTGVVTGGETLETSIDLTDLAKLNKRESMAMAVKGLLTNDIATSAKYLIRKISKRVSST